MMALIPARAWAFGIGFAAVVAALSLLYGHVKERGRAEVRQEIERKDQEAVDAARDARSPVRRCIDDGGVWSTASGECLPRGVPGVRSANP